MDISILLMFQRFRELTGDVFTSFFSFFTGMGEMPHIIFFIACIYWCLDKNLGQYILVSCAYSRVINGIIKITACVYRPWIRSEAIHPAESAIAKATGYSFPSGHSANGVTIFGGLAMKDGLKKALKIVLWSFAGLVGLSRCYLGVHTPQDVIVSIAVSVGIFIGFKKLFALMEKKPEIEIYIVVSGIALALLTVLYANLKSYPMDYDSAGKLIVDPVKMAFDTYKNVGVMLGIMIGWFLERRFVNFKIEGSFEVRLLRFLVCAFGLEIIMSIINPAAASLMPKALASVVTNFLQFFYIVFLAPLFIAHMQKKHEF